ncbi:MAG: outer membrane protein assembly factor BamB family protein [Planctomycetota bacterium]|jgi:outer membrane protein assembly factor BamB
MAALDKRNGQTVWTTKPLGEGRTSHSSPILFQYAERRLIAGCSSTHGFGVDANTGELLWTVPLQNKYGVNAATPVYGSGSIFYVTPYTEHGRLVLVNGTIFAAGYRKSKWWVGVDWQTGQTNYEFKDLSTGAAIYADGRLYCLDERGTVALLKPEKDSLEITGRFSLLTDKIRDAWAHPVILEGRLYLRYHSTLWCYDVKER